MKVLIIDDERSIRNTLKEILEFEGHEVATAGLALHAKRGALKGHVDLRARIAELRTLGVLETDSANILDMRVGWTDSNLRYDVAE